MKEDAEQRQYPLREVFNALRYIVRCGCQWRMMPHDLPPWQVVYQQSQRWMQAGCFEHLAHDLRELARLVSGRSAQPTAVILDGRTLQSSPESGGRAGYDGYERLASTLAGLRWLAFATLLLSSPKVNNRL